MPNKALQACFGADPSGLSRKFVYKFDAMHAGFPTVAAVIEGVNELAGQRIPLLREEGNTL